MRREKRKEGKDLEGGSKKRKEVANDNSLASMFAQQQDVSDLNKTRDTYKVRDTYELQKGKEMGFGGSNTDRAYTPVRKGHR